MRIRLFLSYLLIITLSLTGVALLVREGAQNEIQTFLGRGGLIGAESLIEDLESWYASSDSWEGVERIMPSESGHGSGQEAGAPQTGYRKLATLRLVDKDQILIYDPISPGSVGQVIQDVEQHGMPLIVDEETAGYLLPQENEQQESAQFEERFIARINRASVYAAAISGAASIILALLLAYFVLRPINVIIGATERLAKGDLSYRVDIKKPKEFAQLGENFNQMAKALEQADRRRKDLSADIAHELRTPLAIQRAHLEALIDGILPTNEENITTVLEQNQLLHELVEDLRVITLTDAGELILDLRTVDLRDIAKNTIERFRAQAQEKNIKIAVDFGECPPIQADFKRIQQILHNLLQNGIRYTPQDGTLTLRLTCRDGFNILTIHDSGPGISENALPYIFDRFYRAETSRCKQEGGTGLGLAIARNLAEAHGGSLSADNHPQGGAIFTLKLPNHAS